MADEEGDTDSSQSDFDEVDGGNVLKKATRKISKFFKPRRRVAIHPEGEGQRETLTLASSGSAGNEEEYRFDYSNRGICVIISNEYFYPGTDLGPRPSSQKDVINLKKAFTDLDFFVKVYKNLTGEGIDKKLRKVAQKYDHGNSDCLVCVVLSHGGTGEIPDVKRRRVEKLEFVFGSDGAQISVRHMVGLFGDDQCPDLMGKPRIFLLQACRGTKREKGVEIKVMPRKPGAPKPDRHTKPSDKPDAQTAEITDTPDARPDAIQVSEGGTTIQGTAGASAPPPPIDEDEDILDDEGETLVTSPSPCYMDSLVMFASPPGYFAFLRTNGSWMMTSLSSAIAESRQSNPDSVDFIKVLTHTSFKMAIDYQSHNKNKPEIHNCKVVPCIMSSLRKAVIFKPKPAPSEVVLNI